MPLKYRRVVFDVGDPRKSLHSQAMIRKIGVAIAEESVIRRGFILTDIIAGRNGKGEPLVSPYTLKGLLGRRRWAKQADDF